MAPAAATFTIALPLLGGQSLPIMGWEGTCWDVAPATEGLWSHARPQLPHVCALATMTPFVSKVGEEPWLGAAGGGWGLDDKEELGRAPSPGQCDGQRWAPSPDADT